MAKTQSKPNKYAQMAAIAKENLEGRDEAPPRAASSHTQRPIGKSRDPQYERLTVYIQKKTRKAVDLRLLQSDDTQELSELIETLLYQWVTSSSDV